MNRKILYTLAPALLLCSIQAIPQQAGPAVTIKALDLYRKGDCTNALPVIEEVLQKSPRNLSMRKLLASCLARTGRQEQARAEYKLILAALPNDAEAARALDAPPPAPKPPAAAKPAGAPSGRMTAEFAQAEVLIKQHRLADAEKLLDRVVGRAPDQVPPRQRLAEIYSATERFDKAAALYRALTNQPVNRTMFLLRHAQNLGWAKKLDEAAAAYRVYLAQEPGDLAARLESANVLQWANRSAEAVDEYRAYLGKKPEDADARLNFARSLMAIRRYADASEQFKMLGPSKTADQRAALGLALCYQQMGQPDLAMKMYEEVLKIVPQNREAVEARAVLAAEIPKTKGFALLEANDNEAAARYFIRYLEQHPESDETLLQVARAYSWAKQFRPAADYYRQYLERKPADNVAVRELARVEVSIPDFAGARKHYQALVTTGAATVDDYEGLIHAYSWDRQLAGARTYAKELLRIAPDNAVARQVDREYLAQEKNGAFEKARQLADAGKYPEAVDAYRTYQRTYGADQEAELAVCRLFSWSKDLSGAEVAYHNYLLKYPDDKSARLELANLQKWNQHYNLAINTYREILRTEPRNSDALLGLAQISESKGADAFSLVRSYRDVLRADPRNTAASERAEELATMVSPSVGYSFKSFSDSDGLYRAENTVESAFPFPGRLKLMPYYSLDYFHQFRQVGGASCADTSGHLSDSSSYLSQKICDRNGTYWGNGGGIRTRLGAVSGTNFLLDVGTMRFSGGRSQIVGSADLLVHLNADHIVQIDVAHRPGVFDLNTVGALGAGIMGDSLTLAYRGDLTQRWRLWTAGGVERYSAGTDKLYGNNTQRRMSARLDYAVLPTLRAGYIMRASTFEKPSDLYFSPSRYMTYGLSYAWNHPISKRVSVVADGEFGYGQIKRFGVARLNTAEAAIQPALVWEVYPGLNFHLGYRFSRGSSSAFGNPVYSTGGADFGLTKSLAERFQAPDPARLDLR